VNAVFLPVIAVSGVFFDTAHSPAFMKGIAEALPLYHLIAGLSGAMVTGASLSKNLSDLGVIAVWAIFGILLAVRGFSWEQRRA
jgi:ABC-2 type transport system permease protein